MTRFRENGFTLLEVLVALSVLGVVLVMLGQATQFGMRATAVQAADRGRQPDFEAADRVLRNLVAAADPGTYPEPGSLRGTETALAFTTTLPIAGGASRADVELLAASGGLSLRWRPHIHAELFGPALAVQARVLFEGVTAVRFAYMGRDVGGKDVWQPVWKGDALPTLVRVSLTFPDGSGRRWPPIIATPLREQALQ